MVGLECCLVDNLNAQNLLLGAYFVDIFVEHAKVEDLVEVIHHLLETELMVQIAP